MADSRSGSRVSSSKSHGRSVSGKRSARGVVKNTNVSSSGAAGTSILSKEEEYKKLNEELEAKTANLVKEAEEVLRGQDSVLALSHGSRLLDNINTDEFLKEFDEDLTGRNEDNEDIQPPLGSTSKFRNQSRTDSERSDSANHSRPSSTNKSRPSSKTQKTGSAKSRPRSGTSDDVAVLEDSFLTDCRQYSKQTIQDTIMNIEGRLDTEIIESEDEEDERDDILPQAAQDMGSEATIRFLKAKLRVMQEEMDRLTQECSKKDEGNNSLRDRIKELEDERGRLHRTNAAQQTQIDKFKRIAEDAKSKSDSSETQLASLRKELEQMKRAQKQQTSTQSATEVRLNRALEEIEKQKDQLQRAKSTSKESSDQDRKKVDQLIAENKRLEKQKNELMSGFKKQLKLIDILKRQKMHIEAAKMLSFSEEEFVKALEWGS